MSSASYLVPVVVAPSCSRSEFTIKRSRFITSMARTSSVGEAKAFIAAISAEFSDARHNCFAFNAKEPGASGYIGCSDDGEPHGTAGQPMLNIITHSGIGEICAVVTRYFGGILLGTGGLVKAYQDSIKEGLKVLEVTPRVLTVRLRLSVSPKLVSRVFKLNQDTGAQITESSYEAEATFTVELPQDQVERYSAQLNSLSAGQCRLEQLS